MEFEQRLEKAIQRGKQTRDAHGREAAAKAMDLEELKNLHSSCRLDLSEHIETCLTKLADHFPGFQFETLVSDEGWGARITRDDIDIRERKNVYSRVKILVRPFTDAHIIAIAAKATIRNREVLNRSHFQFLSQHDTTSFCELIDLWVLEYAEKFATRD
jgi:hypothetical protein